MKFIKVFANDTDYVSFRDSTGYTKPNVSLSRDTKVVHYNYPMWDANDKQFVDLGLPSGTLWAACNVGASKPSDYGQYFQWGDTSGYTADQVGTGSGQKAFASTDYKLNPSGDDETFTKYTNIGDELKLEDDAAHTNMGGDWHMPTPEQIRELTANTTSAWTTSDGVSGATFTSTNGKFIFFPAAGSASIGSLNSNGEGGIIWLSMLSPNTVSAGKGFSFDSGGTSLENQYERFNGFSIRGVLG